MEFYLVEEMEFDMIVYHAYRSLIGLYDAYGAKESNSGGGMGMEVEAFGVIKAGAEEQQASLGLSSSDQTDVRLVEFDEQVLQLSWFVLNDTYKTDIPLMYPPYMVALASLWLALSLHTPASEKITASMQNRQHKRQQTDPELDQLLNEPKSTPAGFNSLSSASQLEEAAPPSQEALTFFASLNVSLPLLAEVVQQMVSGYTVQKQVSALVNDGAGMVKLLERMREARRLDLIHKANNAGATDTRRPNR